jgi:hypothetical protein
MIARLNDFGADSGSTGPAVAPAEIKLRVLNASAQEGSATAALTALKDLGFQGAGTANDERGTVDVTEIRYQPGALDKAKTVFRYINPDAKFVEDDTLKGADVAVVLGTNFASIVQPSGTTSSTAPASGSTPSTPAAGDETLTPAPISNEDELGDPAAKTPPC